MTKLAIAIPAYRRADMLAENLRMMLGEATRLGISFYISDDSPGEETERALAPLVAHYDQIFYRRNTPALRHDRNLIDTLMWPDADYVWLLTDSLYVRPGRLEQILEFLDGQDLAFVNSHARRMTTIDEARGDRAHELLREMLWHQTMTGATIYRRTVREWIGTYDPDTFPVMRNFPQLSVILGYARAHPVVIGTFGEESIASGSGQKTSYWHDYALDVFVDDWAALVSSFPDLVPPDRRAEVIRSHSANTKLFNTGFLIHLMTIGHLDEASLKRPHFFDAMHLPAAYVRAVLRTPRVTLPLLEKANRLGSSLQYRLAAGHARP